MMLNLCSFPVNIPQIYWFLVVVNILEQKVYRLDSCPGMMESYKEMITLIVEYFETKTNQVFFVVVLVIVLFLCLIHL